VNLNADSRSNITVELDIFSGRPNPSWTIGPAERELLLNFLRDAHAAVEPRNLLPGLGYRGFVVKIASESGEHVARVHDGSIEIDGKYFSDADRTVEKFILSTMPKELTEQFGPILPKLSP
jgi:hypothetical protein